MRWRPDPSTGIWRDQNKPFDTDQIQLHRVLEMFNPWSHYSVELGGSATEIVDVSGNGRDPITLAAGSNAPKYLAYDSEAPYYYAPVSGQGLFTANPVANAASGATEIDVRFAIALDDWLSGVQILYASGTTAATDSAFRVYHNNANGFRIETSNGTAYTASAYGPTGSPANETLLSLRITWRGSDGRVQYFKKDSIPRSAKADCQSNAGWTQLGSDAVGIVGTLGAGVGNLPLALGNYTSSGGSSARGKVYYGQLATAIDGAPLHVFDLATIGIDGNADITVRKAGGSGKLSIMTPLANSYGTLNLFTDDYATVPANAMPPMGATDAWALVMVIRQWDSPLTFGRYLSTKQGTTTGKGIALRSNGVSKQVACHFGDGTNAVDSFGPAAAPNGARQVVVVNCTGPSVTIWVNGDDGAPVDISSVGDRSSVLGNIGRDPAGLGNFQDFEFMDMVWFNRALDAYEIANIGSV